jgi:hypothetical protein
MGTIRISEKKVKSLLLPKDATNFSMRFAFVGYRSKTGIVLCGQNHNPTNTNRLEKFIAS